MLSLKDMCDIEGIKYSIIKLFVKNTKTDIKQEYDLLIKNKTYNKQLELILILKTYRRLKKMNTLFKNYNKLHTQYNEYEYNDENNELMNSSTHSKSFVVSKILTPHKINCELLTYELLYYKPYEKSNNDDIFNKIKSIFDKYSILIHKYLEDQYWILNYKDTLYFSIAKHTVVLSNTIDTRYEHVIVEHMDRMIVYIKRLYNIHIQYKIKEDMKYNFSWVIVLIHYV